MVKNLPVNAGDVRDSGSIPDSGRSPEGGNSNPLQYSCLENPMDRRAWQTTVHGVAKSWMTERLSTHHFILSNSSVWVLAVAPTLEIHKLRFMEVE